MNVPTGHLASRGRALLLLLAVLVVVGAVFAIPTPDKVERLVPSGLPASYQSTEAQLRQDQLPDEGVAPAFVVVSREDGGTLTEADKAAVAAISEAVAPLGVQGPPTTTEISADGTVAKTPVYVDTSGEILDVADDVAAIREEARADVPAGLVVQVTGPPAFQADIAAVFEGANVTLLAATALVVAVLLLITYRSPWLWIVPLVTVGIAEQFTLKVVGLFAPQFGIVVDESAVGITSVLVFGAATDYALLLIARYRDRLRTDESRFDAMRYAVRRTAEPILASGATVTLALLTLLLAEQETLRGLGFAAAIGVVVAVLTGLIVLPAAMVVFGRGLFWPFVPRVGDVAREGKVWGRIGEAVKRRPNIVGVGATVFLVVLSLGSIGISVGLTQNEQFRVKPEAVAGQDTIARAFPAGSSQPVAVMTNPGSVAAVTAAVEGLDGVSSVTPGPAEGDIAQVNVVLDSDPGSDESFDSVREIRAAVAEVDGADAVVGGETATLLDANEAALRDAKLIIPIVLVLVLLVLVLLLRALLAPVLLVATVLLTFFAALGTSWLIFQNVLGYPALDNGVLLLSFIFLVALGVDYNIFLATRAREEAMVSDTRSGMLTALKATGGVITSAGILLAAVFAVLGVLPLIALAQIGIIVGIGVLLDTLLVRTVLVPALAFVFGERFWWPGRVDGRELQGSDPDPDVTEPVPVSS
ncbi:MMPL family transporter [Longivirga aurantiaca]|uniref:MMPL family transporter n=1 Tax=Longivirga aurantiaca TaxID=1837743 RepID=A0ABW1SY06_9ACTN